jgi:hypothetical protein
MITKKGNFGRNKARLVQQARKAMFYVLRKARKLSLPIDIYIHVHRGIFLLPILPNFHYYAYYYKLQANIR